MRPGSLLARLPAHFVATLGGVGHLRPAPGTWGTAAALPLFWALHVLGGPVLATFATAVSLPLGLWAVAVAAEGEDDPDKSAYVIDELAGVWIALLPLSWGAAGAGVDILALWPGWITAFVAFRAFDILKPGPVGWADRMKTPLGVMLDDVIAGAMAALTVLAFAALAHM